MPKNDFNKKKLTFFRQNTEEKAAKQLTTSDIRYLVAVYNKKYQIKILMNGTTVSAKETIKRKTQEKAIEIDSAEPNLEMHHENCEKLIGSLIELNDDGKKNDNNNSIAADIEEIINEFKILHNTYLKLAEECSFIFKPYLEPINKALISLNKIDDKNVSDDINEVLAWINKLKNIIALYKKVTESKEKFQELKNQISIYEKQVQAKHQATLDDIGLEKTEAIEEIKEIRKNLKQDEIVGYFFTSGCLQTATHSEVIIITKDLFIKPCEWSQAAKSRIISSCDIEELSCLEMMFPVIYRTDPYCVLPTAQAGAVECGTLGMLYLKELLKNNADQLKNFTMNVPFYDSQGKMHHFFIPSPDVLRYSQSSAFNKIILSMFADQLDPVKVPFTQKGRQDTATVTTLTALLKNTMDEAEKKGDLQIMRTCQTLLKNLPEFRAKWLKDYELKIIKRTAMQGDTFNEYLAYSTHRLSNKLEKPEEEVQKTNTPPKNSI